MRKVTLCLFIFLLLLLPLTGCTVNQNISDEERLVVENYLSRVLLQGEDAGEVFAAVKVLHRDELSGKMEVWALVEGVAMTKEAEINQGVSLPVVLWTAKGDAGFRVTGHEVPRDGADYAQDLKTLFSRRIQGTLSSFSESRELEILEKRIQDRISRRQQLSMEERQAILSAWQFVQHQPWEGKDRIDPMQVEFRELSAMPGMEYWGQGETWRPLDGDDFGVVLGDSSSHQFAFVILDGVTKEALGFIPVE
ncbi:hypothetical protein KCG48_09915 [Proteiniclasticum sp. BAD-10]|uniref:Lipoprotein n=2 Tax=Proteiniclasticum sediminis TaxID=2804028 RepID=A0A941CRX0_9CLOT|nr:hypothetical protein [Proteiniclasticum sediminis]